MGLYPLPQKPLHFDGMPIGVGCASCRSLMAENGELRRDNVQLAELAAGLIKENTELAAKAAGERG